MATDKPNYVPNNPRKSGPSDKRGARPAKGQDSRKVHDTKGKNTHGRRYQ